MHAREQVVGALFTRAMIPPIAFVVTNN